MADTAGYEAVSKPSITTTYKRVDGEEIGDYGWVSELDWFEDDDAPIELVEEHWERTGVRRFWHLPQVWGGCEIEWPGVGFNPVGSHGQPGDKVSDFLICEGCGSQHAPSYIGCNAFRDPTDERCDGTLGEVFHCARPLGHLGRGTERAGADAI